MKTVIRTAIINPNLDSSRSITGAYTPLVENKIINGEASIDCHGRFVFRSNEKINDRILKIPFDDISFITIDKEDAQNLYDMLTWAMDQIKPNNIQYKDIDVFGDRAISYERLYDYLHGEDYHIKKQNMAEGED